MLCVALSDMVNNKMILKTKYFSKWARKAGLIDALLKNAVLEIKCGLLDANLGGGIVKKRIALPGRGKCGSTRTLLATNLRSRWFSYLVLKKTRLKMFQQKNCWF